jgi:hypothetical protein
MDRRVRALYAEGRYANAIPLAEQLVRHVEAERGKSHRDTASVLNTLALLYHVQGRYAEAELPRRRALAMFKMA